MTVTDFENELVKLKEIYLQSLLKTYEFSKENHSEGEAIVQLTDFHTSGINYFTLFERSIDEFGLPYFETDINIKQSKIDDAIKIKDLIKKHWNTLFFFATKFKILCPKPDKLVYGSLKRFLSYYCKNEVNNYKEEFMKAKLPTNGLDDQKFSPWKSGLWAIVDKATKAVPATKYAIGIAGLIAVIGIIASIIKVDFRVAGWGTVILLGLMTVLVVFAKLTETAPKEFIKPVRALMWSMVFIFIFVSGSLATSVFFKFPVDLQFWLVEKPKISDEKQKPISVNADTLKPIKSPLPKSVRSKPKNTKPDFSIPPFNTKLNGITFAPEGYSNDAITFTNQTPNGISFYGKVSGDTVFGTAKYDGNLLHIISGNIKGHLKFSSDKLNSLVLGTFILKNNIERKINFNRE